MTRHRRGIGIGLAYFAAITCLGACPGDINGDGVRDNADLGLYVEAFLGGDLGADLNGDAILDNGDLAAFVAAYLEGCDMPENYVPSSVVVGNRTVTRTLYDGSDGTLYVWLGDSFTAAVPSGARLPYGALQTAPWSHGRLGGLDMNTRLMADSATSDGVFMSLTSQGVVQSSQFDLRDYDLFSGETFEARYPTWREAPFALEAPLTTIGGQNEVFRLIPRLYDYGATEALLDPARCNAQLQATGATKLGARYFQYSSALGNMIETLSYLLDAGGLAVGTGGALSADSVQIRDIAASWRTPVGGTYDADAVTATADALNAWRLDAGRVPGVAFGHTTNNRDLLLENFDGEGNPAVAFRLNAFTPTAGRWLTQAGLMVYPVDGSNDWETQYPVWAPQGIGSSEIQDVGNTEGAGTKDFTTARMTEYIWHALRSQSQKVCFIYHFATEGTSEGEISAMVTQMDLAATNAGTTADHVFVVPFAHIVSGGSESLSRDAIHAFRDAAQAVALGRDDMAVVSIYDQLGGQLLNGSAEADAYVPDSYVAGNGATYDLSGGDLLDGTDLHIKDANGPSQYYGDAFWAALIATDGYLRGRSRGNRDRW